MYDEIPVFTVKGNNYLRYFFMTIFIILLIIGIVATFKLGGFMLIIAIASLAGIVSIHFPYLHVFRDRVQISSTSLFKILDSTQSINFENIKEIKFVKAEMDWLAFVIQFFGGTGAYGGFSKPTMIIIKLTDEKTRVIYRIGSKAEFFKAFELINSSITNKPS